MTMGDIDHHLKALDRIPAPELWSDIETRQPGALPGPSVPGRMAVAAVALTVAAAALGTAAWALIRNTSSSAGGPSPTPASPSPSTGPVAERFDGTVVFQRSVEGNGSHVIVLDHDRERDLGPGAAPAWSPDGSRIAFLWDFGQGQVSLYLVNRDGTGRQRLATVGGFMGMGPPAWSREGSAIALGTGSQGIVIYHLSDGSISRLVYRAGCLDLDPAWSPTDDRLAYVAMCDRGIPGSGIHVRGSQDEVIVRPAPRASYRSLAWSPRGDVIAFKRTVVPATGPGENHLFLVAPDGSGLRDLTGDPEVQDGDPSWSPDGSRLVFASVGPRGLYYQIWVMDEDGNGRTRVTFGEDRKVEDWAPSWRPGS
jgi:Tol biopolymer transport system component